MAVAQNGSTEYDSTRGNRNRLKVLVMGDSGVGKSNLVSRYDNDEFSVETKRTFGWNHVFGRSVQVDGEAVRTLIVEEGGMETWRSMVSTMYKGAVGAILVYDVTDHVSFEKGIRRVHQKLWDYGADRNMALMLVGNKTDLGDGQRQVSEEEAKAFAEKHSMLFIETSALDGTNVETAFHTFVTESQRKIAQTQMNENPACKPVKTRIPCCIV